jgi:pimeloyl-ACP methyl ester carboxylesterase
MIATRQRETMRLAVPGGGTIVGDLSHSSDRKPWAVVSCHGLGSRRGGLKAQALEAACAERDWTFAEFDFRGHGASSGNLLELRGSSLLTDLDVVRDHLAGRGVKQLCLVGTSMGGWAAAWFALRNPDVVPAVALACPALRFLERNYELLPASLRREWERTGKLRISSPWINVELDHGLVAELKQFPFTQLAAGWHTPLVILHGQRDEVVPADDSIAFARQTSYADVDLRLIAGGDHRLSGHADELATAACGLFERVNASAKRR